MTAMKRKFGSFGQRLFVTLVLFAGCVVAVHAEVAHFRAWFLSRAANHSYYQGDFEAALAGI